MSNTLKLMTLAVAATLAIAPALGNAQATGAHEHAAHGKLTLDHGKRWPTDEALRTGMTNIRTLIEPQLVAIHAGRLTAAQCGELAQKVEGQVGTIVANCKLEPKADAMTGKNAKVRPAQGAAQVVTALNEYGRYFDHPGWQPVKAGH
jgi:hypothetical protein